MSGKDLDFIAKKSGLPPGKTAIDLLKEEEPSVVAAYFSISPDDVAYIIKSPLQVICTDGIVGVILTREPMVPSPVY